MIELSKPSSFEVEEVIHQLAQNILQGFFKEEIDSESKQNDTEYCQTVGTSRDYLAKLLFWLVYVIMLQYYLLQAIKYRITFM